MAKRDFERARSMDFERRPAKLPTVTDRARRFYDVRQAQLRAARLQRAGTRPSTGSQPAVLEDEPRD